MSLLDGILPDFLKTSFNTDGSTSELVISLIRNGLTLLFAAVILIAIVYAVIAGLRFITSQGEADKVEQAKESLKNVMIGLVVSFLSVIIIMVVQSIFTNDGDTAVTDTLECVLDGNC